MTNAAAAQLSRPYGRHAAPRGTARTVPTTKGPGRHSAAGPRAALADLVPISEPTDSRPLVTRAPLAALVSVLVLLLLAVGLTTTAAGAARTVVERPATCGDYCGTDAGQITGPATFDGAPTA